MSGFKVVHQLSRISLGTGKGNLLSLPWPCLDTPPKFNSLLVKLDGQKTTKPFVAGRCSGSMLNFGRAILISNLFQSHFFWLPGRFSPSVTYIKSSSLFSLFVNGKSQATPVSTPLGAWKEWLIMFQDMAFAWVTFLLGIWHTRKKLKHKKNASKVKRREKFEPQTLVVWENN